MRGAERVRKHTREDEGTAENGTRKKMKTELQEILFCILCDVMGDPDRDVTLLLFLIYFYSYINIYFIYWGDFYVTKGAQKKKKRAVVPS